MNVLSAEDFVEDCKESVAMGTLVSMLAMLPIHIIGMYAFFLKLDKMFNPHRILADHRRQIFTKRIAKKK
jgi:hypothetical protein